MESSAHKPNQQEAAENAARLITIALPASLFDSLPPGQKIAFCQQAIAEKLLRDGYAPPDRGLDRLNVIPF